MAFISSSKNSINEDGNTACVTTASTAFPTGSVNVATISQDTASAYIDSQSNCSQIKFEDINQIDEDDMEEIDIKWSMALLSMRADKWVISQENAEHPEDWSYMANEGEDHALVANEEAPTEFALMANTESKVKKGVGYNAVPPLATDLYLSPKKDLSWTGLPEFVDDTVTDYSKPSPTVASTSVEGQNKDTFTSENVASPNLPKPFVKRRVQRETTRSQNHTYRSPSHRSGGHRPHGAPMRPPVRSVGHRPHGTSMRPSNRPTSHRPHGPSMNPIRPNMNDARPNRSFFMQASLYETRPFYKSLAVKTPYRALWVPTVNRNSPYVNRKFSTGRRNFPTVNRKFPTASRKFTTGSTKNHTADMGRKGKAVKPSACWTWNPSQ
nr:hypothetical protein [Tanacetum cinerariifolium]